MTKVIISCYILPVSAHHIPMKVPTHQPTHFDQILVQTERTRTAIETLRRHRDLRHLDFKEFSPDDLKLRENGLPKYAVFQYGQPSPYVTLFLISQREMFVPEIFKPYFTRMQKKIPFMWIFNLSLPVTLISFVLATILWLFSSNSLLLVPILTVFFTALIGFVDCGTKVIRFNYDSSKHPRTEKKLKVLALLGIFDSGGIYIVATPTTHALTVRYSDKPEPEEDFREIRIVCHDGWQWYEITVHKSLYESTE